MAKFSDNYKRLDISSFPDLEEAAYALSRLAYDGYELVELPNSRVGFLCCLEVDSCTRSCLQRLERVIIEVDKNDPESCCPIAYPDRTDFPFEKLPHVNYPSGSMPPSLCLSRENAEEWYSEITFEQYVLTLKEWLSDAANDRLIKIADKDEYEPFRVPETNEALLWFEELDHMVERSPVASCHFYDAESIAQDTVGIVYPTSNYDNDNIIVHLNKANDEVERDWYIRTPDTIDELLNTVSDLHFELDYVKFKKIIEEHPAIKNIYLAFSVLRPTKLIGKLTKVDTICYKFSAESVRCGDLLKPLLPVMLLDQTTLLHATRLSATDNKLTKKKILVLGAGAVGSKLIDHLYRSGVCNLTICDKDTFLPHNVIRHTLSNGLSFGKKSVLVKEHLEEMFLLKQEVDAVTRDAVGYIRNEDLTKFDLIIDATASSRVMYALDDVTFDGAIVRVCLSNSGKVGMTYVLRDHTKARLQEYFMQILRLSCSDDDYKDDISKWIISDRSTTLDRVRIGEGCHSNTMIVADDAISAHSAISSTVIKNLYAEEKTDNALYLSFSGVDYPGSMFSARYIVPDFVSLVTDEKNWTVRISGDLLQKFRIETKCKGINETGGYLAGVVYEKKKTIFVLGHHVPKDSSKKPTILRLGTSGAKEFFELWDKRTGGQVVYLGDWHSHPNMSVEKSAQDQKTFDDLKFELGRVGVCIITNGSEEKAYIIKKK